MKSAIKAGASDVHVEPMEKGVLIRHRLDGLLKEVMDLPKWVHEGLIARLKIMAGMDIAEKRLPQDGRVRVANEEGKDVDFRASTLRTLHGEKMVLRVLDQNRGVPPLEELGILGRRVQRPAASFLKFQHGMILVVGPTGSGKTTTLCSALMAVQSERTNIITIEDPIEYQLPGINQTQVNEKIKLTFASALRSILRQDPGRDPRRRNPRPGDRAHRDAGRADRPPRAVDAAHRRCAVGGDAPDATSASSRT